MVVVDVGTFGDSVSSLASFLKSKTHSLHRIAWYDVGTSDMLLGITAPFNWDVHSIQANAFKLQKHRST